MNRHEVVALLLVVLALASCAAAQSRLEAGPPVPAAPAGSAAGPRQVIVISDLHMGEGKDQATGRWNPMEDFRWPLQFARFLEQVQRDGSGRTDLIVAGDLLELWQSSKEDCRDGRGKDFGCSEEESLARVKRVIKAHETELKALGEFAKKGENRLIILPGNHDAALLFPQVNDAVLQAVGGGARVIFASNGYWLSEDGLVYVEHGHQIGREVNKWQNWPSPFLESDGKRYLQRPWGEKFVQDYYNRFEIRYPVIDNLSSEWEGVRYAMAAEGPSRTVQDVAGFLKFYFFGVSWGQFSRSLGEEQEGAAPEWDIQAVRGQGPRFLMESLRSDDPLVASLRAPMDDSEKEQLDELFNSLSDDDIRDICNYRASILAESRGLGAPTVTTCPLKTSTLGSGAVTSAPGEVTLGAGVQRLLLAQDRAFREHMEKVVCPSLPSCAEQKKPFRVFVYGHTHLVVGPQELSLSGGYWRPAFVNSGAWQRVAIPEQLSTIRDRKKLPKDKVLPALVPEDIPACYSYVLIKPYAQGRVPDPLVRYWVGEEGLEGRAEMTCK